MTTPERPLRLLRDGSPVLRVGHRGAAALAPANTLRSIEAALEVGVDMVELDVLGFADGRLVLGHSDRELESDIATLDEALDFLAERAPDALLLADVKGAGHERALVDALRAYGIVDRTVAATSSALVLRRIGGLEPRLARSLTYPRDRLGLGSSRLRRVSAPAVQAIRRALPYRIGGLLSRAGASAATLQYRVISKPLVDRCHALGAPILAWTVNDPLELARLDALGVDAVITDDPRIFGATLSA
jgi:glycerophosphoryl diester phosphodiesterase